MTYCLRCDILNVRKTRIYVFGENTMDIIKPRTLSGFMELLPADEALFDGMVKTLEETYSLYGFTPLDTPLIEASEVLLAPL